MERGFTLLELIFVVLIIIVLSLIGSSQYRKHQAKINKKQNEIYCFEGYQ